MSVMIDRWGVRSPPGYTTVKWLAEELDKKLSYHRFTLIKLQPSRSKVLLVWCDQQSRLPRSAGGIAIFTFVRER